MSAYSDRVFTDGASNYWRLGELSGTTAVDVISGANGTISGGVTLNQPGALADGSDKAMLFNGSSGKIVTAALVAIPLACTVEAWVKNTGASFQPILDVGAGAPLFFLNSGQAAIYDVGNGSLNIAGGPVLTAGVWYALVCVLNGSTMLVYLNGSLAVSIPVVRTVPGLGVATLANNVAFAIFWNGALDEVAIYPHALTPAQILAHYQLALAAPTRPDTPFWTLIVGGHHLEQFNRWLPITPSDTVDLPGGTSDGIWVGGGGDISAIMQDGTISVFAAVPVGVWLPIATKRIRATGTTASNLLVLYQV